MGCTASKVKPKPEYGPPETWVEYGLVDDPRKAGDWNETLDNIRKQRRDAALRNNLSVDQKVYLLFLETDIRVGKFYNWAIKHIAFSNIHRATKDEQIIARCLSADLDAGVRGEVVWRGIKDEEPNAVITRAIELGWEPAKTRLDRILAPSVVTNCGGIKWNLDFEEYIQSESNCIS